MMRVLREVGMFVVLSLLMAGVGMVVGLAWVMVTVFRLKDFPDPSGHGGDRT